jgi:hypothetical protein
MMTPLYHYLLIVVNEKRINIAMRSEQDKLKIESGLGDTFTITDFISDDERRALIDYFMGGTHTYKNTGPVTLDVASTEFDSGVFKDIVDRLEPYIGKVKVFSSLFFSVERPHIIHNDDSFSYPVCYKGINIPLELEYVDVNTGWPNLVFYDQHYLEGPAKFFNGSSDIETYYNHCIYEYRSVKNLSTARVDSDTRVKYLTHIRDSWLEGLSIETITQWKPGDITVFDSTRLHSSNDFVRQGVKRKLGLSIFTEKI